MCLLRNFDCTGGVEHVEKVTLNGDVIEKVAKFFHFGGEVQEAVTARLRSG